MIKILAETTINRIAAGEVIERPASVIKELVENSIDAGATKIDIILEQAGKNLIIISDNGSGMSLADLELAVKRHATSKLDEENLDDINSFGFRGEALPSIASISKLIITSKLNGSDKAYSLTQIGGKQISLKPASHELGTKTEVRDLFFATPARLKFLRTDKTEFVACALVIKKLALAHPQIGFTAIHDDKIFLKVKAAENKDLALKNRVLEVLGEDFMRNNAELNLSRDGIDIRGFSSLPTYHKASFEDQYLFVNNRPVKDKILNAAVKNAYKDFVAADKYPMIVLFLAINPKDIDVNVHPAKSEVRFSDPNLVRSLVNASVRDALNFNAKTFINHFDASRMTNSLGYFGDGSNSSYLNSFLPSSSFDRGYREQQKPASSYNLNEQNYHNHKSFTIPLLDVPPLTNAAIKPETNFDDTILENFVLGSAKAQIGYYAIAKTLQNMIVIDLRLASHQLCYEIIKQKLAANNLLKYRIKMPEVVELADEASAEAVFASQEQLSKLGISMQKFGSKALIISELPDLVKEINITKFINDLADFLLKHSSNIAEYVIKSYATLHSALADRKLTIRELNEILRQIEQSSFFKQNKKKQPIFIELKTTDFEKFFSKE